MNEYLKDTPKLYIEPQVRQCKTHGDITAYMSVCVDGEIIGSWCLKCYAEFLDRSGVSAATRK